MENRRDFIKKACLAMGAIGSLGSASYLSSCTGNKKKGLGILTNTISNELKKDYKATLRAIADIGFSFIEGSVPESVEQPVAFRKYLEDVGLRCVSKGFGMDSLQNEMDQCLKTAEDLQLEYMVCYYPWQTGGSNIKPDNVMKTSERINRVGKKIKEAGFRFAWHNHRWAFGKIDDRLILDIILENTDPQYSTVEMDTFWVVYPGYDPVEVYKKYPGRFELVHIKDMKNENEKKSVCPGQGIIDFEPVIEEAKRSGGSRYFIVEHGGAENEMECARTSYEYLSNIL